MTLFDPPEYPDWPPWFTASKNTPGGQKRNVLNGWHPIGAPLFRDPGDRRCGNCRHLLRVFRHTRLYLKCVFKNTASAATDIRAKWPACHYWAEELDGED